MDIRPTHFAPAPGRRNRHQTSFAVRAACYKIALVTPDASLTSINDRVPAARVARNLRQMERLHSTRPGVQGFVIVKACRPAELGRLWILPLGQSLAKTSDIVREYSGLLQRAIDTLVGRFVDVERRILSNADQVEEELGIAEQRKAWQVARESCAWLDRSSQGPALVAVHKEIMEVIGRATTVDAAIEGVKSLIWDRTSIRAKTREIAPYAEVCWSALREQQQPFMREWSEA